MRVIPHSKPWITEADKLAVNEVLISRMLAQGERTKQLECALSEWVGGEGGVAVGSGAAALALAMMALQVGPGDEVILPTYVCTSVFEAVLSVGATPVLCDVGPDWLVTDETMADCLTRRTRALIVPHIYGMFAEVESFKKFGVRVIEDCAQAVGYKSKRSLKADIAIFSLHPTKCLTAGEGGVAISCDPYLVAAMRSIRDGTVGISGRLLSPLSDLSAALGLSQLTHYHEAVDRRMRLAQKYRSALEHIFPDDMHSQASHESMFFRFPLKVSGGLDAYQDRFLERGVSVKRGVDKLLHRSRGEPDSNFKVSTMLFDTTVSLPLYPALTDEEHTICLEAATRIFSSPVRTGRM
jgi:perosamine synthetase